jgi:hypothetical protein
VLLEERRLDGLTDEGLGALESLVEKLKTYWGETVTVVRIWHLTLGTGAHLCPAHYGYASFQIIKLTSLGYLQQGSAQRGQDWSYGKMW